MKGHQGFVTGIAFNTIGDSLFSVSHEGSIKSWDLAAKSLIDEWQLHQGPINDLAYHNGCLATAGHDGDLVVVSESGDAIERIIGSMPLHAAAINEHWIAVGGSDRSVRVYNRDLELLNILEGHTDSIECLRFVGSSLLSGSRDAGIKIWNPATGDEIHHLTGHQDWVTQMRAISTSEVISVGEDGLIIIWDIAAGVLVSKTELGLPIWGLAVQDTTTALIGPAGEPLQFDLHDLTLTPLAHLPGFAARAIDCGTNSTIAFGHDAGGILITNGAEVAWQIDGNHEGVLNCVMTDIGPVTGHQDGRITIGGSVHADAHDYMAYSLCEIDQTTVASGGLDHRIRIWDVKLNKCLHTLDHEGQVFSLTMCDTGLLSGGEDKWLLWDTSTWTPIASSGPIGSGPHTLASASQDGLTIVSVGEDGPLRIWRDQELNREWPLPFRDASVITAAPDGRSAFLGSNDGEVFKIDLQSGDVTQLHKLHDAWIRQIVLAPTGETLFSCSQNGIAVLFDLTSGESEIPLAGIIVAGGFYPDGRLGGITSAGQLMVKPPDTDKV